MARASPVAGTAPPDLGRRLNIGGAVALIATAALVGAPASSAKDGDLDRAFGDSGTKRFSLQPGAGADGAGALVLLPRGRFATAGNSGGNGFGISLHRRNGALINGFAGDGTASVQLAAGPAGYSTAIDLTRGPGSKLLAGGFIRPASGSDDGALAAFTSGGALDPAFGNDPPNPTGDGVVVVDFGGAQDFVNGVTLDRRGRTVAVGRTGSNMIGGPKDIFVSRRLSDGSPDPSFSGGVVTLNLGVDDQADDVLVLPDGRILVAGGSDGDLVLIRLQPDGAVDKSFGMAGVARVNGLGIEADQGTKITRDGKGRIVVGLNDGTASGFSFEAVPAVVRLLPGGRLDRSFSGDGRRRIASGDTGYLAGIGTMAGGRIVVGFTRRAGTDSQVAVARLLPGGGLDKTFGKGGLALVGGDSTYESAGALAVTRDRRILVAGALNDGVDDDRFLVRLLGDTRPPGTRITKGPRGTVEPGVYRLRFRGLRDTGLRFQCSLVRARAQSQPRRVFKPCRSPRRVEVRRRQSYVFSVRAIDPAGNVDRSPAVRAFRAG